MEISPNPIPPVVSWPDQQGAKKNGLYQMYQGGIIVPILIGALLTVITFVIERFLTITKATGNGNIAEFIRKVQYHLANKNVDAAIAECDKQRGSGRECHEGGSAQIQGNDCNQRVGYRAESAGHPEGSGRSYRAGIADVGKEPGIPVYDCFRLQP